LIQYGSLQLLDDIVSCKYIQQFDGDDSNFGIFAMADLDDIGKVTKELSLSMEEKETVFTNAVNFMK